MRRFLPVVQGLGNKSRSPRRCRPGRGARTCSVGRVVAALDRSLGRGVDAAMSRRGMRASSGARHGCRDQLGQDQERALPGLGVDEPPLPRSTRASWSFVSRRPPSSVRLGRPPVVVVEAARHEVTATPHVSCVYWATCRGPGRACRADVVGDLSESGKSGRRVGRVDLPRAPARAFARTPAIAMSSLISSGGGSSSWHIFSAAMVAARSFWFPSPRRTPSLAAEGVWRAAPPSHRGEAPSRRTRRRTQSDAWGAK